MYGEKLGETLRWTGEVGQQDGNIDSFVLELGQSCVLLQLKGETYSLQVEIFVQDISKN